MRQLQQVHSIQQATQVFLSHLAPVSEAEKVPLVGAVDRILAESIVSPEPLPGFARSTMDGYAVRSRETTGASESLPTLLAIQAETLIGRAALEPLLSGAATPISTGAALPDGADAVVMVEYCERFDQQTVAIGQPVAPQENVVRLGEDISLGATVLQAGRVLTPGALGALAALGIAEIFVWRRPRVAIFSTGNELTPAGETPGPGQVRDINSYTLAAQVIRLGGLPELRGILPDAEESIHCALAAALRDCDLLVLSGGSSLGVYDLSERVLNRLGQPGVLVHGLAMKPGKPTLLAVSGQKGCIGFPGHPLSALMTGEVLLPAVISHLARRACPIRRTVQARLTKSIASQVGRAEYVQVQLQLLDGIYSAAPIQSKSAIISASAKADGYLILDQGSEGKAAGESVEVHLWGEVHG